jgi:hypothetical protein
MPPGPTPTRLGGLPRRFGDFATLADALDYAADGETGLNFYNGKGELAVALPYRALRLRALSLARRLLGAGLASGDRVAIVAETHPDVVAAFCACQYAGLVPALLPLPPAFGGKDGYVEHIRRLVGAAQASALFVPEALVDWLAAFARGAGLKAFGTVASLPPEGGAPLSPSRPEDVAYLQFSSGSTRFPTGVAVRQQALMSNVEAIMRHGIKLRPDDRAVSWLPLYHDMGLVGFLLASLAGQVSVDLLPPQDFARRPQVWLRLLSTNRGTLTYAPSFGYELCVRRGRAAAGAEPLDLSAWRVAWHRRRHDPRARPVALRRNLRAGRLPRRGLPAELRHGGGDACGQLRPAGRGRPHRHRGPGSAGARRRRGAARKGQPAGPLLRAVRPAAAGDRAGNRGLGRRSPAGTARRAHPGARAGADARLRRPPGGNGGGAVARRLARHRRPRLPPRQRGGRHRAGQRPHHRQRPQRLAAGPGVVRGAVRWPRSAAATSPPSRWRRTRPRTVVLLVETRGAPSPTAREALAAEVAAPCAPGTAGRAGSCWCRRAACRTPPPASSAACWRARATCKGDFAPLAAAAQ